MIVNNHKSKGVGGRKVRGRRSEGQKSEVGGIGRVVEWERLSAAKIGVGARIDDCRHAAQAPALRVEKTERSDSNNQQS